MNKPITSNQTKPPSNKISVKDLVTKQDLIDLELKITKKLNKDLNEIKTGLTVNKWMLRIVIAILLFCVYQFYYKPKQEWKQINKELQKELQQYNKSFK